MFPDIEELLLRFQQLKNNASWSNSKEEKDLTLRTLELEINLAIMLSLAEISATLQLLATSGSLPPTSGNREFFNMDLPKDGSAFYSYGNNILP